MRHLLLFSSAFLLLACLDPTEPAFQLEDPFYVVEGGIVAGAEVSEVRIRVSAFTEATKRFNPVEGAAVTSLEAGGAAVVWPEVPENPGTYRLPATITVSPGETWRIAATLPDGTQIESAPETIPEPIPDPTLEVRFEQESVFDAGSNRFLPRFELFLSYADPAGDNNYYAFDFRYWEESLICFTCEAGRYRNGECIDDRSVMPRYDYLCDTDECYRITEGGDFLYGDDELTDGQTVRDFLIGRVPFEQYGGLLVEGIIRSVTRAGYDYGRVLQDLTAGNAGLNATIPAALNGNVRNLDPEGQTVLGFFGAAATATTRTYLERTQETGTPFPFDNSLYPEPAVGVFVPPLAPCEVPGRTSIRPEGWGG